MPAERPSPLAIAAAYAALYVVWGSTYLGMAIAIRSMPTFVMGAVRMLLAGGLLFAWERWRGTPAPDARAWGSALIVGGLLFVGGNGLVLRAELSVPSGIAALVIATTQLWMTVLPWLTRRAPRPSARVWAGVAGGLIGVAVLMLPGSLARLGDDRLAVAQGLGELLLASLSWSIGSLWSKALPLPASVTMSSAVQMVMGGAAMGVAGLALGEWRGFDPRAVTAASWEAFAYLVLIGSIVGFGAFVYLMRWSRPHLVATYAVVNPVVAMLLGWALHGERLGWDTLAATAVIVASVAMILVPERTRPGGTAPRAAGAPESA